MSESFRQFLDERRVHVEDHLHKLLRHAEGSPESLLTAIRYSLFAPGKRLRPVLVILAAEACDGTMEQALSAACAVEMIHTYSLIHDDLPAMDDDDLRRGQPTAHKKFGQAMAILAGDALLTMAFQVLATEYPAATAAASCRELAHLAGPIGMVGGQVNDLTWGGKIPGRTGKGTLADLENIHTRKTGALFRASLQLGLLAVQGEQSGGPDVDLRERFDQYGGFLGLAFQITDDLIDVEGDSGQTGKRVGKDAAHGKLTYPALLGIDESRRRLRHLLRETDEVLLPLGTAGKPLARLMQMVVERSH
jgi:geranylgeranyl diphosphate synthase type II